MPWDPNPAYDEGVGLVMSDPAKAMAHFETALALQPDRPRIHANLAWALHNLGRHGPALDAARKAHTLDPNDGYVGVRLAHVLFEAKNYAAVGEIGPAILARSDLGDDDHRFLHGAMGWSLMHVSPAAALPHTLEGVKTWPEDGEALAAHACALGALCRWDEAVDWIERAITKSPSDPRLRGRKADLVHLRDAGLALLDTHRGEAEGAPDDPVVWRALGLVCAKLARHDEALAAFERAHVLDPDPDTDDDRVVAAMMVEATVRTGLVVGDLGPVG